MKKKRMSAAEFRRKLNRMLEADLSKLSPEERLRRTEQAYATAVKVCRGAGTRPSHIAQIPSSLLVARNREE